MKEDILKLFNFHQWGNTQIYEHLNTLPEAVYYQEIKSVFPSIERVWQHLVMTDSIYLDVIRGNPFEHTQQIIPDIKKSVEAKEKEELQQLYQELYQDYKAFFEKTIDFNTVLEVNHPQAGSNSISIADLIRQVVNHGTYHRGNIAAMIRQQGHKGVSTDYIAYLYQVK